MPTKQKILGNGSLTVAARIASVWGGILATCATGVLLWFGNMTLEEFKGMKSDIQVIKQFIAGSERRDDAQEQRGAEARRRLDRLESKVFQ
jgi:hypothetical protein